MIDEYAENGKVRQWEPLVPQKGYTFNEIALEKPLATSESVKLTFNRRYDLARKSSRRGVIDPTTFFVAYFYCTRHRRFGRRI